MGDPRQFGSRSRSLEAPASARRAPSRPVSGTGAAGDDAVTVDRCGDALVGEEARGKTPLNDEDDLVWVKQGATVDNVLSVLRRQLVRANVDVQPLGGILAPRAGNYLSGERRIACHLVEEENVEVPVQYHGEEVVVLHGNIHG